MSDASTSAPSALIDARRREMAIEHLLFGTMRFVAERHPDLLDTLDASLVHLWDRADDAPCDDEAVRTIARRFLRSLRREAGADEDEGAKGEAKAPEETAADDAVTATLTAPGGP